jgi:hypothetical protein
MRLFTIFLLCLVAQKASFAVINFSFENVGSDLVVRASGSLDLNELGSPFTTAGVQDLRIGSSFDRILNIQDDDNAYEIASGGDLLSGSEITVPASATSGDSFGLFADSNFMYLYVPSGFTSGNISGAMTLPGIQIEDVNPIAQTVSWGPSPDESMTITVVPEPSAYAALIGLSSFALIAFRRSKRRS